MVGQLILLFTLQFYAFAHKERQGPSGVNQHTYEISDINGTGRVFEGIGGLSGGGATSKLLVSYKEPIRSQILDYLFKPNFGASLQILKVEIGGDDQSSDGSESSHMHEEWDENFQRGYEWWLMKEAKKRNPDIKLYGLSWAFPGWLGDNSPYRDKLKTALYTVKWIIGAQKYHNLSIDYIGIWNEKYCDLDYVLILYDLLISSGLNRTKIVAPDGSFSVFDSVINNRSLSEAVYAYGVHYPGTYSGNKIINSGKRLWSSEDYSTFNNNTGGGCWARILNQNYVNGHFTSTIAWNLIASYYPGLAWYRDGLMTAMEPWSGHYTVDSPVWVTAHTTQFTHIGWRYLSNGNGVGHLKFGGSYVSLTNPHRNSLTLIVETMSHNHSVCIRPPLPWYSVQRQQAIFSLGGSFAQVKQLETWVTKLKFDGTASTLFQKSQPIEVKDGKFSINLEVDSLYTFTTLETGQHGSHGPVLGTKPFVLPYFDNFDGYVQNEEPHLLAQQSGAWEVLMVDERPFRSKSTTQNKFARQMVLQPPVQWCAHKAKLPIAVIGSQNWTDVQIEVDIRIPSINGTDAIFLGAKVQFPSCWPSNAFGVFLWFYKNSTTYNLSSDVGNLQIFDLGILSNSFVVDTWHKAILKITGSYAEAKLNGEVIARSKLPRKLVTAAGFAALGSTNFGYSDYDNLKIK